MRTFRTNMAQKIADYRASEQSADQPEKPPIIWQPVSAHEYVGACRYTGYVDKSIRLTLACGHEQHRKASQGAPLKARCKDCERRTSQLPSHHQSPQTTNPERT